jgi:hypothetical protein
VYHTQPMSGRVCAACRRFRGAELLRARGYARGAERAKEAGGDKSVRERVSASVCAAQPSWLCRPQYAMLLKALESKKAVDPERPSAEQQRADTERAKDYSRRRMAELRAVQADLSGRIRLRDAAIAALPQVRLATRPAIPRPA